MQQRVVIDKTKLNATPFYENFEQFLIANQFEDATKRAQVEENLTFEIPELSQLQDDNSAI